MKTKHFEALSAKSRESNLRSWLKSVWGDGLSWIEPSRGSSVGVSDVLLPVDGHLVPVELKVWQKGRDGSVRSKMRPSQIRFHKKCERQGVLSGILILTDYNVYWLPGSKYDQTQEMKMVNMLGQVEGAKDRLVHLIRESGHELARSIRRGQAGTGI